MALGAESGNPGGVHDLAGAANKGNVMRIVNNLDSGRTQSFTYDALNRPTTFVSTPQLTASISAEDIARAGAPDVTVVNPPPGGGTSNAATFTISP